MSQYLLSIYQPEGESPAPDVLDEVMIRLDALNQEMMEAGAWVFAGGLTPPTAATVIRSRGGRVTTTDGPFAETKEYLAGFTIIDAPDAAAARVWGRRLAEVLGGLTVELRPFQE